MVHRGREGQVGRVGPELRLQVVAVVMLMMMREVMVLMLVGVMRTVQLD